MSEIDISINTELQQDTFQRVTYAMFYYLKSCDDIATLSKKLAAVTYSCGERDAVEKLVEFLNSKVEKELIK
jgi:hypothetical protein